MSKPTPAEFVAALSRLQGSDDDKQTIVELVEDALSARPAKENANGGLPCAYCGMKLLRIEAHHEDERHMLVRINTRATKKDLAGFRKMLKLWEEALEDA